MIVNASKDFKPFSLISNTKFSTLQKKCYSIPKSKIILYERVVNSLMEIYGCKSKVLSVGTTMS
jgi:hypothetical protein